MPFSDSGGLDLTDVNAGREKERGRDRNSSTSIQPAWLVRMDLCSDLGHVQSGCEAMTESLLVFAPHLVSAYGHAGCRPCTSEF